MIGLASQDPSFHFVKQRRVSNSSDGSPEAEPDIFELIHVVPGISNDDHPFSGFTHLGRGGQDRLTIGSPGGD